MIRTVCWILTLVINANSGLEPSDYLVPPGWQGNPWGPEAVEARRIGELPTPTMTPEMARWDRWGRQYLRTGDVVFRRGDAHILFGYFPFSRFIANVNNSPYSHTGVVVVEDGEPMVYDTTKLSVRRQPFAVWTMDIAGPFGVKRLRPELQSRIPLVVDYVQRVYAEQVPFDYNLRLDDEALYCVELTEKAFRAAGIALSEPIRLGEMERAAEYPLCMFGLWLASKLTLDEPLDLQQQVFFPGNERTGIWSSPQLQTVFSWTPDDEATAARVSRPSFPRQDPPAVR